MRWVIGRPPEDGLPAGCHPDHTAANPADARDHDSRQGGRALPGRRPLPPTPQVATDGADIGVALAAPDDHSCLLGARIDGKVLVWRPSRVQVQPSELSCAPRTTLARQGTRPPH
jgi:hypothetical protein